MSRPQGGPSLPFHYGWVIVATGTLIIFSCLGLGRFALGMLLPSMGETLGLSYKQMGFISTGNFIGYLLAVVAAGWVTARVGARHAVFAGLVLVAASMAAVSQAGGFFTVMVLYIVTGIGSGLANVPLMGLVSHWFARRTRGKAAGFIVSGSGYAIVLAGLVIPVVNDMVGAEGWRVNWLLQAGLSAAVAIAAIALLRNDPAEMGLEPVGGATAAPPHPGGAEAEARGSRSAVIQLGLIYMMFGATYVVYATFIVTEMVQERGFSEATAGGFWSWVGFLSLFSGPVFGALSDKVGRRAGMAVVFALHFVAYGLVAATLPDGFLYASIILYGMSVWAIPSIMAAAVGDYMGPARAVGAFGTITLFFGMGQIVGPGVAGWLADATGTFAASFLMTAALALTALVLCAFLRRPQPDAQPAAAAAGREA